MILVDSTVWIDYFNGRITPETTALDNLLGTEKVIMGDIILAEVLQGFRSDQDFETARQALIKYCQVRIEHPDLAVCCARNYRQFRKIGITVRKTVGFLRPTIAKHYHIYFFFKTNRPLAVSATS